jgi:YVTN family beta-propeller protein
MLRRCCGCRKGCGGAGGRAAVLPVGYEVRDVYTAEAAGEIIACGGGVVGGCGREARQARRPVIANGDVVEDAGARLRGIGAAAGVAGCVRLPGESIEIVVRKAKKRPVLLGTSAVVFNAIQAEQRNGYFNFVGEIAGVGRQGTAVDPETGHGFTNDHPEVSMFDTKTLKRIKRIDVGAARPDGILFDASNQRVYVFSHPSKDATVIDTKDGTVLGTIDLGGVPEEAVADGKGTLYVVMQDAVGSITVMDVKSMKATAITPSSTRADANGRGLDVKNQVLFAACSRSGNPPAQPSQPMMVILSAKNGTILANLPIAGGSDGATFNPATMEAFSAQGNGTMTIVKEQSPPASK